MPEIINLRYADNTRDVVHRVVEVISEKRVVGLPLGEGYALCVLATDTAATEQLADWAGELDGMLAFHDITEIDDVVSNVDPAVDRLMRRCWPGDVHLVFTEFDTDLIGLLPSVTRDLATRRGGLRLCIPDSQVITEVQQFVPGPLLFGWKAGGESWNALHELTSELSDRVPLVVDRGRPNVQAARTVINISSCGCKLQPGGGLSMEDLTRMQALHVVFVCTGNTCRSPMAERLFRKAMADRLNCRPEELLEQGVRASSAGLAAMPGAPASPEALDVCQAHGVDLGTHVSQPLTRSLLAEADLVYTMTAGHRNAIIRSQPQLADRVQLLSRWGQDISDPMGLSLKDYDDCRTEIAESVRVIVEEIVQIL